MYDLHTYIPNYIYRCLGIYRDGTLPIMSRNLQGWNITNQGREFTGMELCSVCNGRRTHCFTSGYFRQTGVTDRLMEVYKFRRALTEITGMELNICITMRKNSFEALTQIMTSRAAPFAAKNLDRLHFRPFKVI